VQALRTAGRETVSEALTSIEAAMGEYNIPPYMRPALARYLVAGIKPADFLCAVLRNDLMEAVIRADDLNGLRLLNYARFLYNEAPRGSYGSAEKFKAWRLKFGFSDGVKP
jgi:hypothetical protein